MWQNIRSQNFLILNFVLYIILWCPHRQLYSPILRISHAGWWVESNVSPLSTGTTCDFKWWFIWIFVTFLENFSGDSEEGWFISYLLRSKFFSRGGHGVKSSPCHNLSLLFLLGFVYIRILSSKAELSFFTCSQNAVGILFFISCDGVIYPINHIVDPFLAGFILCLHQVLSSLQNLHQRLLMKQAGADPFPNWWEATLILSCCIKLVHMILIGVI